MRVVFSKVNGAVLAARQFMDGDQVIDPSAVAIFPAFSGAIHDTFTFSSGIPVDLEDNFINYQVDNIPLPTTTILKNHIEIVLGSISMTADGKSTQTVTINIKDPSDVIQNVALDLDLTATGGFLQQSTVTTVAGIATVVFISGNNTEQVNIRISHQDIDTVTGIGGVNSVISDPVSLIASATVQTPSSSVVQDISVVRTMQIVYHGAIERGIGISLTTIGAASAPADVDRSTMVQYNSNAGAGNFAGVVQSVIDTIVCESFISLYHRLWSAADAANKSLWISVSGVDLTAAWPDQPATAFGFRYFPHAPTSETTWACYVDDGSTMQEVDSGVTVFDSTFYELRIEFNPITSKLKFFINGVEKASFTVAGMFNLGSSQAVRLQMLLRNEDASAHGVDYSATQVKYT